MVRPDAVTAAQSVLSVDSHRGFINEHSSLDRTVEISDNVAAEEEHQDMELDDLNSDRQGDGDRGGQYMDFPADSSTKSVTNEVASSFGFNIDSHGAPSLMQDNDTSRLVLGDLEMVREEPAMSSSVSPSQKQEIRSKLAKLKKRGKRRRVQD